MKTILISSVFVLRIRMKQLRKLFENVGFSSAGVGEKLSVNQEVTV